MIPVFLISDENYAKYTAVTIQSVLSGTKEKIEFYLLDGGITQESKDKISKVVKNTGNDIEFIPIDVNLFQNFPNIAHFSINTYFRYLIPDLKPSIHKALYIDTDMIIKGDVSDIYNTDMDNHGIAAVPYLTEELKPHDLANYKKALNLPQSHKYFNAGLLLIDCDYWRQHNISQVLMTKTAELHNKLNMPDQDVLNIVFAENYKILPKQYNLIVDTSVKYFDFNHYLKTLDGCYVLHYTGGREVRPWMHAKVPCYQTFWNIAKQTPFYTDLLVELMFNYMDNMEHKDEYKTKNIKIFGFIPFLKIKTKASVKKVYLFGFIPLLKIKTAK